MTNEPATPSGRRYFLKVGASLGATLLAVPATTIAIAKGSISDDGKLMALQHKVISPSYLESVNDVFDKTKPDPILVEGIGEQAYEIPNLKTAYIRTDYHVPLGAWRPVSSSTLAFAHECFIDELSYKAKKDPLAFRLEMLSKPLTYNGFREKSKTYRTGISHCQPRKDAEWRSESFSRACVRRWSK